MLKVQRVADPSQHGVGVEDQDRFPQGQNAIAAQHRYLSRYRLARGGRARGQLAMR